MVWIDAAYGMFPVGHVTILLSWQAQQEKKAYLYHLDSARITPWVLSMD